MVARLVDRALKKHPLSGYERDSFTTTTIQVSVVTLKEYFYKIVLTNKFINELADSFNTKQGGRKSSLFCDRALKFGVLRLKNTLFRLSHLKIPPHHALQYSVITSNETSYKVVRINNFFLNELANSFNTKYKGRKPSLCFYSSVTTRSTLFKPQHHTPDIFWHLL